MPPLINKSWPILLMPVWWVFWFIGLLLHNCYFKWRNKYKHVKGHKRDPKEKKKPTKGETKGHKRNPKKKKKGKGEKK